MSFATILPLISVAASLPLALYCFILARRLKRLNSLETGLGGAIAVMTSEISRLDKAIRRARTEAETATAELAQTIETSRNEKAYWALQSELSRSSAISPGRRLRPRNTVTEHQIA